MSRPSHVAASVAAGSFLGLLGLVVFLGAPAAAQTRQYTPPGGVREAQEERKELLENAVDSARWQAGPVRFDPAFWISDLAWVDNPSTGADSELTARAGLGLRAYLPVGGRTTLAAYALPEYVWWQDHSEESRVNQRFGVGSFTYLNRLSLEITAVRNEDFDFATGESLQRVSGRKENVEASIEVPVFRKISLFARGFAGSFESLAEEAPLSSLFVDLNRDETGYRGGLRYQPTDNLTLGGGIGHSEAEFADEAADRSNSGDYWYAEIKYDRPKLGASIDYQENDLEGEPGSAFGAFDGETLAGQISWRPRESFDLRAYGSRGLAYSLFTQSRTAYIEERFGVGARFGLGWRLDLELYVETGTQEYEAQLGGLDSSADVDAFGATLTVELGRAFDLRVGYRTSEIGATPGIPAREIEEIRASLDFGIGGGSATWF